MLNDKLSNLIKEIKTITNNDFYLEISKIKTKDNYFLIRIQTSESFKKYTLDKIKRLYDTYKDDAYQKKIILEDIKKLFFNNWDGAYSELIAYDLLNLIFDNPCKIQINDIKKEHTLAKYCNDAEVSDIDGYLEDAICFFEIKTLRSRLYELINKLKSELESHSINDCFIIQSDYPLSLEITSDKSYSALKKEILNAKRNKERSLASKTIRGLFFRFYYERQPVLIESHNCETNYQMAERLERLPLNQYKQYVDGQFIKAYVCNGLNLNNNLICNEEFFRALARRVFCRLTKVEDVFDDNSDLSTAFIAKHLSGLLFIVDLSANIQKKIDNPKDLYEVYLYSNPNAEFANKLIGFRNFQFNLNMKNIKNTCDDFEYDNY